ncbi:hypothetical protein CONPUDRAFT_105397 [Coniophora puteana RWD-64-598 SS2]|uniref:3-oxo-5-alpha-steroid 4-dehydrogenase C-terminal domain-containing protein n=1 Tax=Coniophora puteana (strain RWD-64-598) TaxID=741705 RepID=A0A5M3MMF9_CONPW|nr:uncharacterized protein CONPUDRAFT_105397 [Coniophora puteana RWD-64-598 SS2]EIW80392.1 hypothetical protein CONPUDRAFT_105397 [Coniophora puteana RWD-64-598 SS2]
MYPLFDSLRRWFFLIPTVVCPANFFIDAPFGRFVPDGDSILLVDGIKSWILMELVSPITFLYTITQRPFADTSLMAPSASTPLSGPQKLLAGLFLLHYLNRALISPLRTPSRSKSHIMVPLAAISFNLVNGSLMASYLSSSYAASFLEGAFSRASFWAGVGIWAAGLAGNIVHDEVLLNLRRKKRDDESKEKDSNGAAKSNKQHYAIPHGYMYSLISYPNYFCEWCEWAGFAFAASPLPSVASWSAVLSTVSPPWVFVWSEVLMMIPRAYKGHKWYHDKFPDYPKERKAVVPFVF